jgi:hypothetical protein
VPNKGQQVVSGRGARLLLATGGFLAGTGVAVAGDWRHSVSVPMTLEHDSNFTLNPTNKAGITRTIIAPTYNVVGTYGVDELTAGLGLRIEQSSAQSISANREDPNLLLGWRRQIETGELGLTAKYAEVSARTAELAETGLVVRDSTRKTQSLAGHWRRAVSERSNLAAAVDYTAVTYNAGALNDYNNASASFNWGYAWSERIEPFLYLAASHYDPQSGALAASNNAIVMGGVKRKVSERLEWTAQAGMSKVSGRTSTTGSQGSFALRYLGTRYDMTLDAGRATSPSGTGGFVESDQIKGTWSYAYDQRSRLGLDASWRDTKGTIPNTLRQVGAWVSRELTPFWNARLSLLHRQRQQNGQPDASSSVVGLSLVYSHPNF